jgi:hypothetical protein
MPQVTNQVTPGEGGAPQLYGTQPLENAIPFQARLMRLFQPQEFVRIKNIDDAPVYWQYMPAHAEVKEFTPDGMQQITRRTDPEMWVINPGEVEVLVGASAYMALDTMYKNVTAKKTLHKYSDPTSPQYDEKGSHLPKNFNFADGGLQENFIKQAYLGKATLNFESPAPAIDAQTVETAKELTNAVTTAKR